MNDENPPFNSSDENGGEGEGEGEGDEGVEGEGEGDEGVEGEGEGDEGVEGEGEGDEGVEGEGEGEGDEGVEGEGEGEGEGDEGDEEKKYFSATFSIYFLDEGLRGTSLQLCGRKKYVDEILEDNSNNVVSKRLWWNAKAQTFHVDIIIERDVTTSDGSKNNRIDGSPASHQLAFYVTTDGKVLFASSTEPLVRFEKKIGCLVKKIAKRHFLFVNPWTQENA